MASTLWTKESAATEARNLAEETKHLAKVRAYSEEHTRWLFRGSRFLREVFGENSPYYRSISSLPWEYTGTFMAIGDPALIKEKKDQRAYLRNLDAARGAFLDAADQIERVGVDAVYEGKNTAAESSAIVKVLNLAEAKLRKVVREKPSKEKDVQDAFENLLIGAEIPYSREMDRIEYSSKTYVPDFTMPKIDLATEVKFCNREDREKEIIAEMNDDILAYGTKYGNLIFIVYDLGFIRDAERFAKSFEEHQSVLVRVVKH
jgi:hypothetical protein